MVVDDAMLTGFDIDEITLENLLFQTGYLTIEYVEELSGERFYPLTYPNREVKASLNSHLLQDLTHAQAGLVTRQQMRIYNAFEEIDPEQLQQVLTSCMPRFRMIGIGKTSWPIIKVIRLPSFIVVWLLWG